MEVSTSHEDNCWWESVGQVESVEKIMKNMKTGKVTKIMRKNNLLTGCFFFRTLVTLPVFNWSHLYYALPQTIVFISRRYLHSLKFSENGFPIVFSECDLTRGGANLSQKNSEIAKPPELCPNIGGNRGETEFHQCPFIPPSY